MSFAQDMKTLKKSIESAQLLTQRYNVVMMGSSGVGKTVLMTALLAPLLKASHGLSIRCSYQQQQLLQSLYQQLVSGNMPAGTAAFSTWDFTVCFNQRPLFDFRWIDYRGGDLLKIEVGSQAEPVYETLLDASFVLILTDAEQMMSGCMQDELQRIAEYRQMIAVSLQRKPRPLYVGLMLMKCDKYFMQHGWFSKTWDEAQMARVARQALEPLAELENQYDDVLCEAIPISSLGLSASYDQQGRLTVKQGPIQSYQVNVPLYRCFEMLVEVFAQDFPQMKTIQTTLQLQAANKRSAANLLGNNPIVNFLGMNRNYVQRKQRLKEAHWNERQARGVEQYMHDLRAILAQLRSTNSLIIQRRWAGER
jgi:hypothetical protein